MRPPLFSLLAFAGCCALARAADAPPKKVENVPLKNAGFELPKITARTPEPKGANPAQAGEGETVWTQFQSFGIPKDLEGDGQLVVGMTNELFRSGQQALYVDFQKLKTKARRAFLMSDLVPVQGGNTYRISMWGRIDKKRPLTLDQRRPFLQLEVTFFQADGETQTGEAQVRTQMIPGKLDRLVFVPLKWSEFFATVRTPDDAALMQVTFRWETTRANGVTDGMIYFDDAAIARVIGGETLAPPTPGAAGDAEAKPEEPAVEPKR